MHDLPVCRPWSCKGLRTFDSFSPGPARFVAVNDGTAEVPALLMSQELFTLLDRAVRTDHDFEKEYKNDQNAIWEQLFLIDEARAKVEVAKVKIRHLKRSMRHDKTEINEYTTSQLISLYKSKATHTRRIKHMSKAIKKLQKEDDEAEEEVRDFWRDTGLLMTKVWERAGIFDVEQPKDDLQSSASQRMQRHKPKDVGEVVQLAVDLLVKRHQSARESYESYQHHLKHREQGFLDWLQSKGIECGNQYETDEQKDAFYRDYKKKAEELYQDVEKQGSSYKNAYEVCRYLGIKPDNIPLMETKRPEELIGKINHAALDDFKIRKDQVNAWVRSLPDNEEYDHFSNQDNTLEGTGPETRFEEGDLYPWDSGSCSVWFEEFTRKMNEHEALRAKAHPEIRLGKDVHDQSKFAAPGDAVGPNLDTTRSMSNPPTFSSVPPCGSVTKADVPMSVPGEVKVNAYHRDNSTNYQPSDHTSSMSNHENVPRSESVLRHTPETDRSKSESGGLLRGDYTSPSIGSSGTSMFHRKRKFEELTGNVSMNAPKRIKAEPFINPEMSLGDTKSGIPRSSAPLIDSYVVSPSERNRPIGTEHISSVPQKETDKQSDIPRQGCDRA
ncbi:hypothetical protein P171DRAFT_477644 [Karstenula rhodostoma CBS 690.94]|uniref:Uncharacterized protein n=1 Tax=Karstenula rhodostoma CBS 690.94 TaxID=1392251 RepID=A0A9P4P7S1_9PLEO|nr:hypothetical protein P171DRAFT_477644 [Karstenula rhodostoma CBS 690.94]